MTLFIKLERGLPVGHPIVEQNFRELFPQTSFPKYFTADAVEPLGYGIYDFSNPPEVGLYQKVTEVSPVRSSVGIWRQTWQVVEMTDAEKLEADAAQAYMTRSKRNFLLAESDWVVVFHTEKGTNIPVEWKAYRQSLRDITAQPGFPHNVTWPEKP